MCGVLHAGGSLAHGLETVGNQSGPHFKFWRGNNMERDQKLIVEKTETGWSIGITKSAEISIASKFFFGFLGKWIFVGFGAAIGVKIAEYILTK